MPGTLSDLGVRTDFHLLFDDYQLLGYVGQAERLLPDLASPGIWNKITGGIFSDIGKILKPLIGTDLSETVARLDRIFEDKEKRKVVADRLTKLQERLAKEGRRYRSVETPGISPILSTPKPRADSLVCVEGCLALRSAILQYYPQGNTQLGTKDAWFLTDGPPNAIYAENKQFGGSFLVLDFDPAFNTRFDGEIPFWRKIGWFPYVRATGYFRTPSKQTAGLEALSVGLIEYRNPQAYLTASHDLVSLLRKALDANEDLQSLTTRAYLAPLIYEGGRQSPNSVIADLLPHLNDLKQRIGDKMPHSIRAFYDALR